MRPSLRAAHSALEWAYAGNLCSKAPMASNLAALSCQFERTMTNRAPHRRCGPSRRSAERSAASTDFREGCPGVTATPVIALVAQSVNQVIDGLGGLPSHRPAPGSACGRSPTPGSGQPRVRARNSSCLHASRSPPASPVRSPGVRSRRIARCSVGMDGGASPSALAARGVSSRCTAAALPFLSDGAADGGWEVVPAGRGGR